MSAETGGRKCSVVDGEGYVAQIENNRVTIWFEDGMRELFSLLRSDSKAAEGKLLVDVVLFPEETFLERVRRLGLGEAVLGESGVISNTLSAVYERSKDESYRLIWCPEGLWHYDDEESLQYVEVGSNRAANSGVDEVEVIYRFPATLDAKGLMDQAVAEESVEPILSLFSREVTHYPSCNP